MYDLMTLIERAARRTAPSRPSVAGSPRPVPSVVPGDPSDSAMGGGPEVVFAAFGVEPTTRNYRPTAEGDVGREYQGMQVRNRPAQMPVRRYVTVATVPPPTAVRATFVPANVSVDGSNFLAFTRIVILQD